MRAGLFMMAGAAAALLSLELLLRCLPVGGLNIYAADPVADWPVHHLVPNANYVHSTGWSLANVSRGHVNAQGYAAPADYSVEPGGIALLGDSYLESLMNNFQETVQGRLPQLLAKPLPVRQFGMSGSSLPDYLGVGGLVAARYHPQWFVLLLTLGDYTEGFQADDGHYSWQPNAASLLRLHPVLQRSAMQKRLRTFALFRYLRYNLKVSLGRLLTPMRAAVTKPVSCMTETLAPLDQSILQRYVDLLPAALGVPATHILIVVDANRAALYAGQRADLNGACPTRETLALTRLRDLAVAHAMHVVDTAPMFTAYYQTTQHRVDHSPTDMHWNAQAHRLVATELASIINSASPIPVP